MEQEAKTFSPPYGPTSNLKTIFDTWRERSMPGRVEKDWLERAGISANLIPKNIYALRFLGLIDEEGYTTPVAERLRGAASEEYAKVLEEIVRKAYRAVFEVRNPSQDSRNRIADAFRKAEPQAQRNRMVACFLGLCSMALIPLKESPPVRESTTRATRPRAIAAKVSEPVRADFAAILPRVSPDSQPSAMDPVLRGLIHKLAEIEDTEELESWFYVYKSAFEFVKNTRQKTRSEAGD